jgi:phosphopentomutase
LEEFDERLGEVFNLMNNDDLLMITADHGNDPVHPGTDHTREYIPLLIYHKGIIEGKQMPISKTFADIGATVADNFGVPLPKYGQSLLQNI